MSLLDGRTALVTGAWRGNGAGIANALADHGARVVLTDVDARVEETARAIGRGAVAIVADVSSEVDVERLFERTLAEAGLLDVLVNNAGILRQGPFLELSNADWEAILRVNLTGAMYCCRLAARHMVERGSGSIVNITSMAAELAPPNLSAYCVSKGGLQMLTRALAVELAPHGVRVNAVAPAVILTEMTRPLYPDQASVDRIAARIPMGRLGLPEDVAGAVVFLASELAAYVTGGTVTVDGGYMVR